MPRRPATTLSELLVAVSILTVLAALLLSAVQKVRQAAALSVSRNNLKQIILGTQQYVDQNPDRPTGGLPPAQTPKFFNFASPIFECIIPYVHGPRDIKRASFQGMTSHELGDLFTPMVKCYRDPADTTWGYRPTDPGANYKEPGPGEDPHGYTRGLCCYGANMQGFDIIVSFPYSIPDGATNTIAFAQRYATSMRLDPMVGVPNNAPIQTRYPAGLTHLIRGSSL